MIHNILKKNLAPLIREVLKEEIAKATNSSTGAEHISANQTQPLLPQTSEKETPGRYMLRMSALLRYQNNASESWIAPRPLKSV